MPKYIIHLTPPKTKDNPVAHEHPCETRGRYCPKLNKSGCITSTFTQRQYSTKIRVDCKSGNLIYCITCKIQYVGQTKKRLMDRFQGHFYNISSKNTKDTIGQHFSQPDHSGLDDIEIHIVDFVHANPSSPQALALSNTLVNSGHNTQSTPTTPIPDYTPRG